MKKEKCLLILLLSIVVLIAMSVNTFAVESITGINSSTNSGVQSITNTNTGATAITSNTSNTTNKASSSYNATNTSSTAVGNSSSSLPYAGTNSTAVFIIVIFVVSSIYAYKKVSDYNININTK